MTPHVDSCSKGHIDAVETSLIVDLMKDSTRPLL